MANLPLTTRAVLWWMCFSEAPCYGERQFIDRDGSSGPDIENAPTCSTRVDGGGRNSGGHNITDRTKVAGLLPIPINHHSSIIAGRFGQFGNHPGIRRVRTLPRAENIEEPKHDGLQPIKMMIDTAVVFRGKLLHGVVTERSRQHVFPCRLTAGVSVNGGRRGEDKPTDAVPYAGFEQGQSVGQISLMRREGPLERTLD